MAETSHSAPGGQARPRIRRVRAVLNVASGGVGRDAQAQLSAVLAEHGLDAHVVSAAPGDVEAAVRAAVDAAPDVLILLAGDGTARFAAQACGPRGPLLAPLAGGTMNMLPHALYGARPWRQALEETLEHGVVHQVSGGEVEGRSFYVAAILGSPALWASAREALREGRLRLAFLRAERAVKRAFGGRLRFCLDGGETQHAEALTLMCPLVSRGAAGSDALEASALDPRGAASAFRLGIRTVLPGMDWRADPAVRVQACRSGRAWAKGRIPVVLDGEPHRLPKSAQLRFLPVAFRALAPPRGADGSDKAGAGTAAAGAAGAAAGEAARGLA